jgi:hypothetical protein
MNLDFLKPHALAQMSMPMNMPMSSPMTGDGMVMAPDWLTLGLGIAFLVGTLFYAFRLCRQSYLIRVNGYADSENELWHGICLLAMAAMLTPAYVPVPALIWLWVLPVGSFTYLVRSVTYGRRIAYNKQWYDFAHAAMLFGMWWMFAHPVSAPWISYGFAAYWTWFGGYYLVRIFNDFKKPHWLTFGQDIFHFTMASVMVVMTLWPNYFMVM